MYTALYRTERPETFDQVLGQDHIVRILKNQVNKGTVGHAYLFCGTRGTGKTSVARILAKGVNCIGEGEKPCGVCPNCQSIKNGTFLDVIEIDAASNNGIENIRELRESVNYPPTVGKRKVYIIDEAHELTDHALNALLKTLEEPPENVMFVLATTDPQKLLQTILSRCLRLDFHRVGETNLKMHMANICHKRNVEITEEALSLLAANADGSVRDALSLLDQCLAGVEDKLDRDVVLDYLGTASEEFFIKLTEGVVKGDPASSLILLDQVLRQGKDVKQILADWLRHYRSLLIGKYVDSAGDILNMSSENASKLVAQAKELPVEEINRGVMTLAKTVNDARYSPQPRTLMELAIVELANGLAPANPALNVNIKPIAKPVTVDASQAAPEPIPEVAPELSPEAPAAERNLSELDYIWKDVWDSIDNVGSLTMIRINSKLGGMTEKEFKVLTTSPSALNVAEKNKSLLEDAMEKVTGQHRKMVLKLVEDKAEDVQEGIPGIEPAPEEEVLQEELESLLNIKVNIE